MMVPLSAIFITAVLIIILLCLCSYLYYHGYEKGQKKGLLSGRNEVARQLNDAHYWFKGVVGSHKGNIQIANTLYFIQHDIRKNGHFNVDKIRHKVFELGNTPYSRLTGEELEYYLS